ncbi:MAG: 50S ribosomal protein L2 [Candidatus Taylorbacteria bacterium]|nr:50S ribosomal protein L2 [Candidatus Taylorbacteria bacterium]
MKTYRPTSPGRRQMQTVNFKDYITKKDPEKSLTYGRKRDVGRNAHGRVTVRHKGGGHKRLYRDVTFSFDKRDIPAVVQSVEYDPNRSGFIGLVAYKDGERRYVLLPKGVRPGAKIIAGATAPLEPGNALPLKKIPVGTFVYNVELKPQSGAKLARAAGIFAQVIGNDAGYTMIKMPSTEVRKVHEEAFAMIGQVSNDEHWLVNSGKAGRSRWLGIRPTVRGTAQNPVDHPYGGGEGRQGRGLRRLKTRWGKPSGKGQKTRTPKKYSNVFIVSRRKVGKDRNSIQ